MSDYHGRFCWYELMTTDTHAAEAFYRAVIGWGAQSQQTGVAGRPYTILSAAQAPVGGLMALPTEAREGGAKPLWIGYVAVDDVDLCAKRVTQAGGSIHRAPDDIPGVGRFAVVADPQGAAFVLFRDTTGQPNPPVSPGTPGHTGWRELHAGEWQSAFAFYSGLFGWTKTQAVDMGPMGTYQLFAAGNVPVGGMMTKTEAKLAPFWLYYFNVEHIDAAAARVKEQGGQILNGPQDVPGGNWIIQCLDPQGARFALVAAQR